MRPARVFLLGTVTVLLLLALLVPTVGQNAARPPTPRFKDGDWPRYTGDFAGTRYSKLKQINTNNVARLASAWTFAGVGAQQTPIAIDGVIYASTSTGVVAMDGDTGKEIWRYGTVPAAGGGAVSYTHLTLPTILRV